MKTFKFNLILLLLVLGTSCSDSNDNDTPSPTSANISGSVNLFDDGVTEIDNSNMTVNVEGTSISTTTNSNGQYTLSNVPFDTVTLVYEKNGYGTFKRFNIDHSTSDTFIAETPSLGQLSTTSITNLTATNNGTDITLAATTDPDGNVGNTRYIRFFFSTQSNVSNTNYEAVLETLPSQINPRNLNLTNVSLVALGFSSGQTVYARCYGESFWSNQYDEPNSENTIFPNLNPNSAIAVSFVVP
ncbi:carboxypeptidase-like regulatory domain-containing protein [Pontimicrobium sp. MEBiC06410]